MLRYTQNLCFLEEVYFDDTRKQDLGQEDICKVGALIGSMLKLEPGARASAKEALQDSWCHEQKW